MLFCGRSFQPPEFSSCIRRNVVHTSNSRNLETGSDLGRQSPLSSAQDNVQELLRRRHRGDILPRRLHVGGVCCGMLGSCCEN
jgi:hypothetical protein